MSDTRQNNAVFQLSGILSQSGTSVTVSSDINNGGVVALTNAEILLVNQNGTKFERVIANVSAGTLTIVTRGITKAQTLTTDSALQYEWRPGTICIVTLFADDMPSLKFDNVYQGTQTFGGLVITKYIRDAVYADATARDAVITSPENGMRVYNTALGLFQKYQAGAWTDETSGGATPNASATMAGKVEEATSAESIAGTVVGGTGADLFVNPLDIAKNTQSSTFIYGADAGGDDTYVVALTPVLTTYTTGQRLSFEATAANTGACSVDFGPGVKSIKLKDGTDPLDADIVAGSINELVYDGTNFVLQMNVSRATDAEAITGTNTVKFINPKQAKDNYGFTFIPGTEKIAESAGTLNVQNSGGFIKAKEILIKAAGTYRVSFGLWCSSTTGFATIYKNGSAFGTARSTTATSETTFTEDLVLAAGDLLQLYYNAPGAPFTFVAHFSVNVTVIPNSILPTVNI